MDNSDLYSYYFEYFKSSFSFIAINMIIVHCLGSNSEAQAFLQRDGQVIIRMRGLPFDATAKDVVKFIDRQTFRFL